MLALLASVVAGHGSAAAVPLDAPTCEQLQVRLDTLRSEGAAADMARGPEWASANLSPERLQRIGALIEAEEQLNFRCGLAKARITLPTTVEGGEEEVPGPGEAVIEGTSRMIMLPLKAPPAPDRPAAAAVPDTASPTVAPPRRKPDQGSSPRKAPAKKQRPQADDAYRPPPSPLASDGWAPAVRQ
jgi:hypothetical protein